MSFSTPVEMELFQSVGVIEWASLDHCGRYREMYCRGKHKKKCLRFLASTSPYLLLFDFSSQVSASQNLEP